MSVQTQHFPQVFDVFFTIEHVPWPFQVESLPGHAVNDEALEELTVSFARPWGADLLEWLRREKEKNPQENSGYSSFQMDRRVLHH
jgi:hypothetical protein